MFISELLERIRSHMIFLFGGRGSTPSALNITVDHVLFLKLFLQNKFMKD